MEYLLYIHFELLL